MNRERPDGRRDSRQRAASEKAKPVPLTPPRDGAVAPAPQPPPLDVERFIGGILTLDAVANRYLAPSPDGGIEVLRRPVTPSDQATLKPLIAESARFVAAYPA